jgi:reactive intermediate/imine deaminase
MMLRIVSFKHQKGSIKMKYVSTEKAPAAIGPYSQGIIAGDFLYASGQIPINPENGKIEAKTIEEQADQAIRNAGEILKAAGADYKDVVKTTCFLSDMSDFAAFNAVYEKYFTGKPARSCVAAAALPKNVKCEVEVTAYIGK